MKHFKYLCQILVLIILGTLVGLFASEMLLRIIRPDIKEIVHNKFVEDRYRIYTNPKKHWHRYPHPDLKSMHFNIHNLLGLRQHREFNIEKKRNVIRIGFFGDSFTENLRLPVQYSFTEPLDYLLNKTGKSYEVLNFGTDGYGTDQIYLQYIDEGLMLNLDVVVYVYCHNDLKDILADQLIDIDENGNLKYLPERKARYIIKIIKKFYITYFLIEAFKKMEISFDTILKVKYEPSKLTTPEKEEKNRTKYNKLGYFHKLDSNDSDLKWSLRLFSALVSEIKKKADLHSQKFIVVLIPFSTNEKNIKIKALLEEMNINVFDLRPLFELEDYNFTKYHFKNDAHWNEEGNKIAAVHIFKYLSKILNIDYKNDDFIRKSLWEYYESFSLSPLIINSWLQETPTSPNLRKNIRSKYRSLEKIYVKKEFR